MSGTFMEEIFHGEEMYIIQARHVWCCTVCWTEGACVASDAHVCAGSWILRLCEQ